MTGEETWPLPRRGVLGLAALAGLPALGKGEGEPQVERWDVLPCPGCGRDVCFLPRQRLNRCGWCGKVVRHAVE